MDNSCVTCDAIAQWRSEHSSIAPHDPFILIRIQPGAIKSLMDRHPHLMRHLTGDEILALDAGLTK